MRALVAALVRRPGVLRRIARSLPLGALRFGGRVCRRLRRRRLASPVAIPVAIVMSMLVTPVMLATVLVTVMPLPMLPLGAGRRLILLLLSLRLALFGWRRWHLAHGPGRYEADARRVHGRARRLDGDDGAFTLAFRVLKPGLRSTETPDFLEFRLGVFGGGAICRLWGCSVRRRPRWLRLGFGHSRNFCRSGRLFNCRDCRNFSAGLIPL